MSAEHSFRPRQAALAVLVTALAFAAAYGEAPLYYSNQNQYLLHGFAQADVGFLREDWLANTIDPTPVFSALVATTVRYLSPVFFYVYLVALMAAYAAAMLGIFVVLVGPASCQRRNGWPVFAALLVFSHSAALRWLSYHFLGNDYPWFFQAGVAGQYVLGAMLQPSTFGVLLILGVCFFVENRIIPAVACLALAATVHATLPLASDHADHWLHGCT